MPVRLTKDGKHCLSIGSEAKRVFAHQRLPWLITLPFGGHPGGHSARRMFDAGVGEHLENDRCSRRFAPHLHWQFDGYAPSPRSCHKRPARAGPAKCRGRKPMSFGRTSICFLPNVSDCCRNAIRLRQTDISYSASTLSERPSGLAAPLTQGVNLACSNNDEDPVKRIAGDIRHRAAHTGLDEMQRFHRSLGSGKKSETRKHRISQG